MKAKEAIKIIGDWISEETHKRKYNKVEIAKLSEALIHLKCITEQQDNRWIPVSERLPEKIKKWEDLLVCSGDKVRFGASYNGELYIVYRDGYMRDEKAIAWQPLPEPWEESAEE